ncbi:MAG: sigma 54-interacting transcriptional regulator [Candidatus Aminicenantes bacterium]
MKIPEQNQTPTLTKTKPSAEKKIPKTDMNLLLMCRDSSLNKRIKNSSLANLWNIVCGYPEQDMLSCIKKNQIHVVLLEAKKEQASSLLSRLKKFDSLLDVVILGENFSSEEVMDLIHHGATDFLAAPFQLDSLEQTLNKISNKRNLRKETLRLEKKLEKKYYFHGMIGKSPYMLEVFSLIENISKYFISVLITGETGTGKEMAARAIHNLSSTRTKRFVVCDCVSVPESLFESELFGYMKGAFTGAHRNKKGLFEEADGGIIFLDEMGEIPLPVQAKLLRVLEHHQFRPLGSNQTRRVDVKVIAATSRNLRQCIQTGSFREDLFHRLNKVEVHLPPLRERPEDIPLLARHFLGQYRMQFSKELKGISRQVQKLFRQYRWPGNVRELENVLERAAMLCQKDFIGMEDLPKYLQDVSPSAHKIPFLDKNRLSTLDELEKEYIAYLLKTTGRNLRKTAKILDISRTTLYNKLKKYNIPD